MKTLMVLEIWTSCAKWISRLFIFLLDTRAHLKSERKNFSTLIVQFVDWPNLIMTFNFQSTFMHQFNLPFVCLFFVCLWKLVVSSGLIQLLHNVFHELMPDFIVHARILHSQVIETFFRFVRFLAGSLEMQF